MLKAFRNDTDPQIVRFLRGANRIQLHAARKHHTVIMIGVIADQLRPPGGGKKRKILAGKALNKFFGKRLITPELTLTVFRAVQTLDRSLRRFGIQPCV